MANFREIQKLVGETSLHTLAFNQVIHQNLFTLPAIFGIFRSLLSVKLHLTGNECIQLPHRKELN